MAALVVEDVVRTFIEFTLGTREAAVTLDHVLIGTTGSRETACQNVAKAVLSAWHDGPRTRQSNECSMDRVSWLDLASLTGSTGSVTTGIGGTPSWPSIGGVAEDSFPSNVALRVQKNTTATRGLRPGRMYVPGVSESDTDVPNTVASSRLTAWQTEFTEFLTALTTYDNPEGDYLSTPVVIHQQVGEAPTSTLITSMTPQGTLRSQGRRLRG